MRLQPTEIGLGWHIYNAGVAASYKDLFINPNSSDLAWNRQQDSIIRQVVKGAFAILTALLSLPNLLLIGAYKFQKNAHGLLSLIACVTLTVTALLMVIPLVISNPTIDLLVSIATLGQEDGVVMHSAYHSLIYNSDPS